VELASALGVSVERLAAGMSWDEDAQRFVVKLGSRQSGKSTLAESLVDRLDDARYRTLDRKVTLTAALEDPAAALARPLVGWALIARDDKPPWAPCCSTAAPHGPDGRSLREAESRCWSGPAARRGSAPWSSWQAPSTSASRASARGCAGTERPSASWSSGRGVLRHDRHRRRPASPTRSAARTAGRCAKRAGSCGRRRRQKRSPVVGSLRGIPPGTTHRVACPVSSAIRSWSASWCKTVSPERSAPATRRRARRRAGPRAGVADRAGRPGRSRAS
jgi:hypothetical protein